VAKNAYTFAKRSKELAKKKKKEEKQQRKTQRSDADLTADGLPVYDEATGRIIMPETESKPEPETPQD